MTIVEKVADCISRHPDWPDKRVSSAVRGSTCAVVRAVRNNEPIPSALGTRMEAPESRPTPSGVITLDAVRKRFDVVSAIEHELDKLPAGKLISERELCSRTAGKDAARFRRAVENNADRFKASRIRLKLDQEASEAQWFWGSVADIREALRLRDE